jgi:hypothetical protein
VKYVVLAVASDVEAERLIEDLTRYPAEPLRTPRMGQRRTRNTGHRACRTTRPRRYCRCPPHDRPDVNKNT